METWLVPSLIAAVCVALTTLVGVPAWFVSRYRQYRSHAVGDGSAPDDLRRFATERGLRQIAANAYEGRASLRPNGPARTLRALLREVDTGSGARYGLLFATPVPTQGLALRHRSLRMGADAEADAPSTRGHPLGHPEFDVRFRVDSPIDVASVLVRPVRDALLHAAEDAVVRIDAGWLSIETPATGTELDLVAERLSRLDDAATALERVPNTVDARIRALAEEDRPQVRDAVLAQVAERSSNDFAKWLGRFLADDPDPRVRARAVELTGDISRMAALARDPALAPHVRSGIARTLAAHVRAEERLELARELSRKTGHAPPDPELLDVAMDLCSMLGFEAEPLLLEIVHEAPDPIARRAVAQLGAVGSSRAAYAALVAVEEGAGRPAIVRAEAKLALSSMRSRAPRSRQPAAVADGENTRTIARNAVPAGTARELSSQPPRRMSPDPARPRKPMPR